MAYVSGVRSSDLPNGGVNTAIGPIKLGFLFRGRSLFSNKSITCVADHRYQ